ncbi:MAG: A/G-specific adenine glycosylase [Campylobacterota bacterium]
MCFESFTTIKGFTIYKSIHQQLLQWYEKQGRHDLPWRNTDDVYHIYLSETMLQQTQVSRVREHFYPLFVQKYPTIKHLADADLDAVLADWSGLGYYSRARNLHKSVNLCKNVGLPKTQQQLQKLPGIGRYTASAVCSFGYEESISVVDTNIKRVLKRFFGLKNVKEAEIWQQADAFLNKKDAKHHNLALMDLGAMICTAKNPRCCLCPLQSYCIGKDDPHAYTQTKKIAYEKLELFLGVNLQNAHLAVAKSDEKLYHGLLQLPHVDPVEEDFIASFKHSYTKYRITVHLYHTTLIPQDVQWIELQRFSKYPISSLTKKAIARIS